MIKIMGHLFLRTAFLQMAKSVGIANTLSTFSGLAGGVSKKSKFLNFQNGRRGGGRENPPTARRSIRIGTFSVETAEKMVKGKFKK